MSVTKREKLGDFLESQALSSSGGMPTLDELRMAEAVAHSADEFFIEPLARRVFKLLNEEWEKLDGDYRPDQPPMTHEDVGTLLCFVTELRTTLEDIAKRLDAIEESREDLSVTVAAGRVELEPFFNAYGNRRQPSRTVREVLEALDAS